jgi:hypothetical protein
MNQLEFTVNITEILHQMILLGEHPVGDSWKRFTEDQQRLFRIGRNEDGEKIGKTVTNCDGIINISGHQKRTALDILFIENGKVSAPNMGWKFWHDKWQTWNGKPMIVGDEGHFEG